jgi:glyoxylase-like metal-dependent hydrolase (beta-lactamase superfamily II)
MPQKDTEVKRMRRLIWSAFALGLCIAPAAAWQTDFSKVEMKATQVAGNVHMLEGAGGNIGVSVGPDGILIVDDQFAPLADKIRAALKNLGTGKLKFILNTHYHGDHTGGNVAFGPEAPIIAQTNVRKRLETEQRRGEQVTPPSPKEALPVVTFDDSLSVHFNGEEIKVLHVPHGHTDGDSIIFFTRSNVVHMRDQFFNGRFPFVDLDSGGDVEGYARNVEQVIARTPKDAKIIPGHGPLASVDDLKAFHAMLVETTGIVRDRMKAGKTLDQIKKEGVPGKYASWGTGFINAERWIETIHRSLSNPAAAAHHH